MRIALGSDHRGTDIKSFLKIHLEKMGYPVIDMGTYNDDEAVDYPDFAARVSSKVSNGDVDLGILICGTGIGMSIVANKYFNVRGALVHNDETAKFSKLHNNANVLVLSGNELTADDAKRYVDIWLNTPFEGGRHQKRLNKIVEIENKNKKRYNVVNILEDYDRQISHLIALELKREQNNIVLIASENIASKAVLAAQGSVFTNKYAEGYPGKRYYGGCEYCDDIETIAIERAKVLFGADHANVQPISGSAANMAAYFSVLNPGDTILAMKLAHGGHLTHGAPVSVISKIFNVVSYSVRKEDGLIDYDEVEKLAMETKPKLILAGASSYSRIIDFKRFKDIADKVGSYFMVDMAHIAGLVAAELHPSPVPYADIVTSTTHKTLRGPRGGFILCKDYLKDKIDKVVFPGLQGGPLVHTIVAKAIAFQEAMSEDFKEYQKQVIVNAKAMSEIFFEDPFKVVSGGTDNHLFLLDLTNVGITGKTAEKSLEEVGIIVNKNSIPYDDKPPTLTSGIRIGTPTITTRGMKEKEAIKIAEIIKDILLDPYNINKKRNYRDDVIDLCKMFPIYEDLG